MRAAIACVMFLAACDPVLPVRMLPPDDELVAEVGELLGIAVVPDHGAPDGAMTVTALRLCDPRVRGLGPVTGGCQPSVVAHAEPVFVAHEIGHALGLDHVDDVDNIMHSCASPGDGALTDQQRDTIERASRRLRLRLCP